MAKTKNALRESAIGRGSGALPAQSSDVAVNGNLADIDECNVLLLKPGPEVVGSPQMQAYACSRILGLFKHFGDR
jgi:hypothetical protein